MLSVNEFVSKVTKWLVINEKGVDDIKDGKDGKCGASRGRG